MPERVEIIISATDNASKALKSITKTSTDMLKTLTKVAAVGFSAFAAGLAASIPLALDAELAQRNLAQTIKSTGGVAGVTAKEANALADSLAHVTRFSDEQILSAESMLLTFTKIGEDVFPQATETVLNMAEKFGGMEAASIQLGKALNDPVAGVGALREVGVAFTADQQEMINKLVETGDIAGAQKIILDELSVEVGGLARAYGDTAAGKLARFKNRMIDVAQVIGSRLIGPIGDLADRLGGVVSALMEAGIFSAEFADALSWLTGSDEFGRAFYNFVQPLELVLDRIRNLISVFFEAGPLTLEFAQALGFLFASYDVGNFWLSLIEPFQGFINIVREFIDKHGKELAETFAKVGAIIGSAVIVYALVSIGAAIAAIAGPALLIVGVLTALVRAFETDFLGIRTAVDKFVSWFVKTAMPAIRDWIVKKAIPVINDLYDRFVIGWAIIKPLLEAFATWFIEDALPDIIDYIQNTVIPAIEDFYHTLEDIWIMARPYLQNLALWFLDSALPAIRDFIVNTAIPAIERLMNTIQNIWTLAKPYLGSLYDWFVYTGMPGVINFISGTLIPAFLRLINIVQGIWFQAQPFLAQFTGWLTNAFSNLRTSVIQPVINAFQFLIDKVQAAINIINRATPIVDAARGALKWTGIPGFASGGSFAGLAEVGERGSEYVYAPGGAMVLPADLTAALKGMGNTYNNLTVNTANDTTNIMDDFRLMEAMS